MSKFIDVPLTQINFPPACVVCQSPATTQFPIQQVYSYGNKSHTLTLEVPMCANHFQAASHKGMVERAVSCLGVVGGILAGILSVVVLLLRWEGGGGILAKIFMSVLVGFGMFVLAWWVIAVLTAPLFAEPASREARNAVRIVLVQPFDRRMRLEFRNEALADLVEKMN